MPQDPTTNPVDVILAVAALATLVGLVRAWRPFWDADFTAADRRRAVQVAVFLVPPVVVLLHELGHVAAALLQGVEIVGFRYGLFEGSVTVAGRLSPAEDWFLALSGNIVSAAAGLLLVVAGSTARTWRRPLRYVLVTGGLFQLGFSLVGYPLLSLSSRFGDWLSVYDFGATPALSTATAAVHVAALAAIVRWWRSRGRNLLFAIGAGVEDEVERRRADLAAHPADEDARFDLARFYLERREAGLARQVLDEGAAGGSPRLHLARARLALAEGRWSDAVVAARAGLEATGGDGADDLPQRLWANQALALGEMGRSREALAAFEHLTPPVADDARVAYGRGLTRLALGDEPRGRLDLEAVVRALPEGDLLRRWAEARLEGREPEPPDDSHLPNYARGGGPPPAPIAGV